MTPIDQAQEEIRKMPASRQQAIEQMLENASMAHPPALSLFGQIKARPLVTLTQGLERIKSLTMGRRRSDEHNGSEGL